MAEEEKEPLRQEPLKCECGAELWVERTVGKTETDGFVCTNPGCPFNWAKREGPRGEKVRLLTQKEAKEEDRQKARVPKRTRKKRGEWK